MKLICKFCKCYYGKDGNSDVETYRTCPMHKGLFSLEDWHSYFKEVLFLSTEKFYIELKQANLRYDEGRYV